MKKKSSQCCTGAVSAVLLVAISTASAQQKIDPTYAVNLTVYHQDRATAPPGIDNKNTGDAPGDAYFSLKDVGLAHECREDPRGFDCQNPETNSNDLVVTKLVIQVDSRFGPYGMCNVDNRTNQYQCSCPPATPKNCSAALEQVCGEEKKRGAFCKLCIATQKRVLDYFNCTSAQENAYCTSSVAASSGGGGAGVVADGFGAASAATGLEYGHPCGAPVGKELVVDNGSVQRNPAQSSHSHDFDYWNWNLAHHVGGNWYSTTTDGKCNSTGTGACTWRVLETVKRVEHTCQKAQVLQAIQQQAPSCFNGCPDPTNTTTDCYASCFYDAVLGAHSGSSDSPTGGIAANILVDAWTAPFASEDASKGGCPSVPFERYELV